MIQSQFELQALKSIPSADQIANVICRRKFRQFCQFFQSFPAKELILNSLTFLGDICERFSITGTVSFNLSGFIAHYEIGVNQ